MIRMTEMMKKSAERRAGWLLALALAALLMVGPLRVAAMGQAQAAGSSSQISDSNSAGNRMPKLEGRRRGNRLRRVSRGTKVLAKNWRRRRARRRARKKRMRN